MARTSKTALKSLLAASALAMLVACADTRSPPRPPERGDGGAPSLTVDESIRQWRARRRGEGPAISADAMRPVYPRTLDSSGTYGASGLPSRGTAGGSSTYAGAAPGLPSIPMRPDATTIPTPGRTTFPLPGGTTIPTPMDPLSPNPATVTFPPLGR